MRILSIDPGNVTGVAWYDTDDYTTAPRVAEVPDGLSGFVEWYDDLDSPWWKWDLVLVEDFIIRPDTHKKTREPAAYELLGYIKGTCYMNGVPCQPIGPAEHTSFTEYKKKRKSKVVRLGWGGEWTKDLHSHSACSILIIGLKRNDPETAARLLKEIAL